MRYEFRVDGIPSEEARAPFSGLREQGIVDPTTRDDGIDPATTLLHMALGAAAVAWRAGAPLRDASVAAARGVGTAVSSAIRRAA
jgi:hypothetical protein